MDRIRRRERAGDATLERVLTPTGDLLPRVLTSAQARRLGYTDGVVRTELRRGRWTQLSRGVYLTRIDPPTRADWIRTALLVVGPGAAVSGWDAVRARGIGARRPPDDRVLVLASAGTNRILGKARIRPSVRELVVDWGGLDGLPFTRVPLAHAARSVADTARMYRVMEPVRALVTSSVQRRLCTPDELHRELLGGQRNGSAHLRRAVMDVFGGAESIAEAEVADLLRTRRLPPFEQNVPIRDARGEVRAVADVLWRELRAILEVDSRERHFLEPDWARTMRRHNMLASLGYAVTHYPPVDFRTRAEGVLDEIETWLGCRARELLLG